MKALVKRARGKGMLEIQDIPKPEPKAGELLVKVMAAGICGSDIHIEDDEYLYVPGVPIGHEYTGIIEEIGEGVGDEWKVGDQIVSFTLYQTCGRCRFCRSGMYMLCSKKQGMGVSRQGPMAEYMCIPAETAFKIPDDKRGDYWALMEPASCCLAAVIEHCRIDAGDVALVTGPGTMGLLCMQMAKLQGAKVIVAGTAVDKQRLELATKLGAVAVCDDPAKLHDIVQSIAPEGVDIAIECSGTYPGVKTCIDECRMGGHIAQVGLVGKPGTVNLDDYAYKGLSTSTNYASEYTSWLRLMKLVSDGRVDLESLVSHRVPLENFAEGFAMHRSKAGFKVLLIP